VGEGGVQSTVFLLFQPLLLYFKSKQAQNLSHNKATRYTQYHAKTWKQRLSERIIQSILKGTFSVECAPYLGYVPMETRVEIRKLVKSFPSMCQTSVDIWKSPITRYRRDKVTLENTASKLASSRLSRKGQVSMYRYVICTTART